MKNSHINRRRFCKAAVGIALLPCLGLSACAAIEPELFITGETMMPPIGCVELLERSDEGDC